MIQAFAISNWHLNDRTISEDEDPWMVTLSGISIKLATQAIMCRFMVISCIFNTYFYACSDYFIYKMCD